MPVVWFQTNNYSATTDVSWVKQYQAYTSNNQIIPNGQITASFSTDIDLDQTLQVGVGGVGPVVGGGQAGAISIQNMTKDPFTCGISEVQGGTAWPLCAFPLYGLGLDVIMPIEKVLLMFSTLPVDTGTVIVQAYSPGIFIDLTADNERQVAFDINQGWSWGGYSWAQQIAANSDLLPLLVEPLSASARRHRLAAIR